MAESPNTTSSSVDKLACPECGREFTRRGLAPHRRMSHSIAPAPALPAPSAADVNVIAEIARTIDTLSRTVEQLDQKVDRVLHASTAATSEARAADLGDATLAMKSALKRNLEAVLNEIARVRIEFERELHKWGGVASTDEQRGREHTTNVELGRLRRQQTEILYRLSQLGTDDSPIDLCIV